MNEHTLVHARDQRRYWQAPKVVAMTAGQAETSIGPQNDAGENMS